MFPLPHPMVPGVPLSGDPRLPPRPWRDFPCLCAGYSITDMSRNLFSDAAATEVPLDGVRASSGGLIPKLAGRDPSDVSLGWFWIL